MLKQQCQEYVRHAQAILDGHTVSLKKQKELDALSKKELLRVAQRRQKEELERLRCQRQSLKEAEDRRKRIVFEDLKEQVLQFKYFSVVDQFMSSLTTPLGRSREETKRRKAKAAKRARHQFLEDGY